MSIERPEDRPQSNVSIIIPTYKRPALLLAALQAVSQQTYRRDQMEVIVVNDGSDDEMLAEVESLGSLGATCLHQPHLGATKARNMGASHAKGDILVFMDDDIELLPAAVESLVSL